MFKSFLDSIMFTIKHNINKRYKTTDEMINDEFFKEEFIDFIIW